MLYNVTVSGMMTRTIQAGLFLLLTLAFTVRGELNAQENPRLSGPGDSLLVGPVIPDTLRPTPSLANRYPVVLNGDTLFSIMENFGAQTAAERRQTIQSRLLQCIQRELPTGSLRADSLAAYHLIRLDTLVLMAVSDADALAVRQNRSELAREYRDRIRAGIDAVYQTEDLTETLIKYAKAALALIIVALVFWGISLGSRKLYVAINQWGDVSPFCLKFRTIDLVTARGLASAILVCLRLLRLIFTLALLYYLFVFLIDLLPFLRNLGMGPILAGLFKTVGLTALIIALYKAINALAEIGHRKVEEMRGSVITSVKIKRAEILSEERIAETSRGLIKFLRLFSLVSFSYLYVTMVFSVFSFTKNWADTLVAYITNPLKDAFNAFITYLPNLFTIIIVLLIARYTILFSRFIFIEIRKGTIEIRNFHREWAAPTFNIVRFLIIVFALIAIVQYLPFSDEPAFQGVSVLLGLLISFSSGSAIANIVSGIVLTYMRPFRVGDRVKIADTTGDIVDKTLLVTRIRTIKNVDVTIPNSMVLGSHITNFSSSARSHGLILNTTVTIGYDVPWELVHKTLVDAALATDRVLKEPTPFVLQTALNDFYPAYELNAYISEPNKMALIYSDIHRNIQDKCNEVGIEILSPHYSAVRDGNHSTIPENHLPKDYKAPGFKLDPITRFFTRGAQPGSRPPADGAS